MFADIDIVAQVNPFPMVVEKETIVDAQLVLFWNLPQLQRTSRDLTGAIVFNNPLTWYRDHFNEFPIISQLARRLLCIPATSAPSERLFSDAGLTIAKDRANLLPEMAASIIFLQDAWDVAEEFLMRNH